MWERVREKAGLRLPGTRLLLAMVLLLGGVPAVAAGQDQHWQSIEEAFDDGARHARYWQEGWGALFTLNLARSVITAVDTDDSEARFDARVDAVKSSLAILDLLLMPLPHEAAQRELARLRAQAEAGDDDALRRAEVLFRAVAEQELQRRTWRARIGYFAVNLAAGLTIAYADDRPADGAVNFATGMLVKEIQLRTQPRTVSRAWDGYRPVALGWGEQRVPVEFAWTAAPGHAGVALRF